MRRIFAVCAALLLLAGCAAPAARPQPEHETTFLAMDTVMTLRLYEGGDGALLELAQARVAELEGLLSVTDPDSEVSALNRDGQAELSPDAAALLSGALALCESTAGALDVSIYPVLRAWGFTTGEYTVPGGDDISALLAQVDYARVELEGNRAALPPGMELDLGSVAKGYAGDELAALLKEGGVTSAVLDLGGNIQTVGSRPDGAPWRIAIRAPEGEGSLGVVEVADQAVVTSGGYERYFEEGGVRYWHILDPETGAPARSGLLCVTVIGDSGLTCDGLSTALFVMGLDGALDYWRQHRDFEAVLVSQDGSLTITAGLEGRFTPAREGLEAVVAQP